VNISNLGLPERIKLEVENLVHASAPGLRIKTMALGSNERALTTFLGIERECFRLSI
jgi:hypothetical protein